MAGRRLAAALLLPAVLAAGCCSAPKGYVRGDRDTPERAFAFVRDAFLQDSVGDQLDSFHRDFMERMGFTKAEYTLARSLRPGLFAGAAEALRGATLATVEGARRDLRRAPGDPPRIRSLARVTVETPSGTGVFILVDEPVLAVWPLAPGEPEVRGHPGDLDRIVRFEGEDAVLEGRIPVDFPPEGPLPARRIEIHHDWLLFGIERLTGFEEFLGEVKAAAEEEKAKAPPAKEGAPQ